MTVSNEDLLPKVEQFLYEEAAFLDDGKLNAWLELFTEDGVYLVAPLHDRESSTQDALYMLVDDPRRLKSRVKQMLGGSVWAENPPSRTRRLLGNVRILSADNGELVVTANFSVYRFRHEEQQLYVGKYEYHLIPAGNSFKIRKRLVALDHESLRQGKLSIIV